MNVWLTGAAVGLLVLSLLLARASLPRRLPLRARVRRRLNGIMGSASEDRPRYQKLFELILKSLGELQLPKSSKSAGHVELAVLLPRAGWYRREDRVIFYIFSALAPVAVMVLTLIYGLNSNLAGARMLGLGFVGAVLAFLLPRYGLRYLAAQRQRRVAREVPVLLRLLNVLFEASLSLEHALSVVRDQADALFPALDQEIGLFLQRVKAGADRVEALNQTAATLDVPELTDAIAVLTQAAQLGGGIKQSLTRLAQAIEERDETTLRETIGRLSAKMTIVMVVFLFPALFIFLAGPGLLAVGRALGSVSG